jgi:GTPase SAR1 family protein
MQVNGFRIFEKDLSFAERLSMTSTDQLSSIKALGKIEAINEDIRFLSQLMDAVPLWRSRSVIKKQCDEVLEVIENLEQRFDRKLVVTLIGPTGSGKSTLLNALAGIDGLSESGHERPTTRGIVVLSKDKNDSRQLIDELGYEKVKLRTSKKAVSLEHVMLIDTPDTDSTEQEKHLPIVRKAIRLSDILICLFDAENPKRRDYVDFLAPFVQLFEGDSLFVVLNKCDRLDENELRQIILPEFKTYLTRAWERDADMMLCISARNHLQEPAWNSDASPRHDFDQYDELSDIIFDQFNEPGYAVDRRVENAQHLRNFLFSETRALIEKDSKGLASAKKKIQAAEKQAIQKAVDAFHSQDTKQVLGVNVRLYQRLTQRWIGPIGWVIAFWTRILIFGTGLAAIFRFGNPVRQTIGMISALLQMKETHSAVRDLEEGAQTGAALENYRNTMYEQWPDIAETLVEAGFDPTLRNPEHLMPSPESLNDRLTGLWQQSLEFTIEDTSRKLANPFLQLIFNLPTVGLLVHTGWLTGKSYFSSNYLSSDFFLHAALTILLIIMISFLVFQILIRSFYGPDRLIHQSFYNLKSQVEGFQTISTNPLIKQIETLLGIVQTHRDQ